MLHRASFVPTTLTLAVAVACNINPDDTPTSDVTGSPTGNPSGDEENSSNVTTSGTEGVPTTGDQTSNGPTTQTTPGTDTTAETSATDTGSGGDTTIYQVQGGEIPVDTVVTIKGVVVTSQLKIDDTNGFVFVEEPEGGQFSGIELYLYDDVAKVWDAPPGTIIDITGTYSEFYDNSQITIVSPDDVTVVGPGELPPVAAVTSDEISNNDQAAAEPWEGVVVQVSDAVVTELNPNMNFGQWEIDDVALFSDFFLYPDNPISPTLGQVYPTLTGPLLYSFNEFQIAPRTLADLGEDVVETTGTDTGTDTGTTTGGEDVTIYDIQQGMFPIGTPITVEGVVATSGLTFKKDGFFVQEPGGGEYSGIYVYIAMLPIVVEPGDVLTITGTYDEFFMSSQIKVANAADVMITSNGPTPAAEVVNAADIATNGPLAENYEGVLVRVNNVDVTAVVDMFGEFQVEGALQINDLFIAKVDWVNPMVGDNYSSITGPLEYSFDAFKVSPPTPADVVP